MHAGGISLLSARALRPGLCVGDWRSNRAQRRGCAGRTMHLLFQWEREGEREKQEEREKKQ